MSASAEARLAVSGGPKVRSQAIPPWPCFGEEDVRAVAGVLRSGRVNYWTGDEGKTFEAEFARFVGTRHAVAVANGTVALELALRACGVAPGDEVVVPSRTFIATASAVVMAGATPVVADICLESQNLTPETVRSAITQRTKAIIAVHLAGWPCDMASLRELADEHGLRLIEDCAQAHGARFRDVMVGALGHVAAFSFCQDKIMTTGGEGGMVTTDLTDIHETAWSLKDHGKSYDGVFRKQHKPGFRWLHDSFGTNWRMTEMQAALGRVALRKLPGWVEERRANAAFLNQGLAGVPGLRLTLPPSDVRHSYYKYYAFVKPDSLRPGWDRDRIAAAISAEGVFCQSGSCSEIYLEKAFDGFLRPASRMPAARQLGETSLMLLVHPTLGEHYLSDTANAITKVMAAAAF